MNILDLNIVSGPVPVTIYALALAALVYLMVRPPSLRWLRRLGLGLLGGLTAGILTVLIVERGLNSFGGPIGTPSRVWVIAAFTASGVAVVNLWASRWWRKVVAVLGIASFGLSATVGINADFGLSPTLGSFLHVEIDDPVTLPAVTAESVALANWTPPAGMPVRGAVGTVDIPNPASGFAARRANVYLPPAALTKNPPKLPLMIMLMGQPGDPDPRFVQSVLDTFSLKNDGLAPIVVVADQLGAPTHDPLCIDSNRGRVETYLTQDVLSWARQTLNVSSDPAETVIAGYSNGGQCAIALGSAHPDLWHNILDISGEKFAGQGNEREVLSEVFGGDKAAYEAIRPAEIMAKHAPYRDTTAVFTYGGADQHYGAVAVEMERTARAAGMTTAITSIEGAGHGSDALAGGLKFGFEVLYPVLHLSR